MIQYVILIVVFSTSLGGSHALAQDLNEILADPQKLVANRDAVVQVYNCLLYTSPSPRDRTRSRMPSSA